MVWRPMGPGQLAGVLVRPGLQGVALPEASAGAVPIREVVPALARDRLRVAGPTAAGLHALHAPAIRKVRHDDAEQTLGQTRCQPVGEGKYSGRLLLTRR